MTLEEEKIFIDKLKETILPVAIYLNENEIKRIIENLYFPQEELKPQEVREFGMETYGEWAGYVQLYLFHYARKSGLLESLRKK